MGRKSSIDLLPPDARADLDRRLADGRLTLDELVAFLSDQGFEISRSAVGRYAQRFTQAAERLKRSREMADALVAEIGPAAAEGKTGRLLAETLQSIAFNQLIDLDDGEDLDAKDLHFLARAIKDLAGAQSLEAARELAIRKETAKAAAEAVTKAGKAQGLSKDTIASFRSEILGVAA